VTLAWQISSRTWRNRSRFNGGPSASIGAGVVVDATGASPCDTFGGALTSGCWTLAEGAGAGLGEEVPCIPRRAIRRVQS
jgi:hypothetical protein